MKWVRKGRGARMGVHHTRTNGALGLFANQAGGCWMQNNGGSVLLMKWVRKDGRKTMGAGWLLTKWVRKGGGCKDGCAIHELMVHWACL